MLVIVGLTIILGMDGIIRFFMDRLTELFVSARKFFRLFFLSIDDFLYHVSKLLLMEAF